MWASRIGRREADHWGGVVMGWFWANIPLMLLFFACWAGIPLWLTLTRWHAEITAKHAEIAAAQAGVAAAQGAIAAQAVPAQPTAAAAEEIPALVGAADWPDR
jgi:hypothetical protein